MIEVCENDTDCSVGEEALSDTEISYHALLGAFNPKTICMKVNVSNHQVFVVIDSGSTHNFIQNSVACKLGMGLKPYQSSTSLLGVVNFSDVTRIVRKFH